MNQTEVELLALTPEPGRGKRQFDDLVTLQGAVEKIMKKYRASDYFEVKIEQLINRRQVPAYGQRPARVEE